MVQNSTLRFSKSFMQICILPQKRGYAAEYKGDGRLMGERIDFEYQSRSGGKIVNDFEKRSGTTSKNEAVKNASAA